MPSPDLDPAYRALIASGRVSARTRAALTTRATPDDPAYRPRALDQKGLAALRAAADRVLPQPPAASIDLAARIDADLAAGGGDGWRFAALPPDAEAYRAALITLDGAARDAGGGNFAALDGAGRDAILRRAADGTLAVAHLSALDAAQMRLWFEDFRADAVRAYVSHPATMARIGYSGIAYGGDGEPKPGFSRIGAGEAEIWEPRPAKDEAAAR